MKLELQTISFVYLKAKESRQKSSFSWSAGLQNVGIRFGKIFYSLITLGLLAALSEIGNLKMRKEKQTHINWGSSIKYLTQISWAFFTPPYPCIIRSSHSMSEQWWYFLSPPFLNIRPMQWHKNGGCRSPIFFRVCIVPWIWTPVFS